MQRAAQSRGFTLSHQRVALELGFGGTLAGYTELTIVPTDRNLRSIHLNCRQAVIQHVSCSGYTADYSFTDLLSGIATADSRDVHRYPQVKRKLYAAASDGNGGELSILLPPEVKVKHQSLASANGAYPPSQSNGRSNSAVPEDAPTPGGSSSSSSEFAPITVKIKYYVKNPVDGIQFVRPTSESPYRIPHLFTIASSPDAARCWVPCVDSLWERCTWEFEFVVPKYLASTEGEEGSDEEGGNHSEALEDSQVVVVCTGDLIEQVAHPHNSAKTIFYFSQAVATSVQHVAFAAGPFHLLKLQSSSQSSQIQDETEQPDVLAFCLPGREEELKVSVSFTRPALDFYSREFGSYPFGSFKMVFVDEPPQDCTTASTLAICSSDLLHPASVIDQALENRQILSHAIAFQWVGINIVQASWSDTWLINGLGLYITGLFLRRLLGNNEYRFRLKKDCDRLCAWDIGMPPLYQTGAWEPPDASLLPFVNLKAPLVLHILDRRLCKQGASLGLGRVIPKVFLQSMTGELPNNALSTQGFLRTCKKVSGADLKLFSDQWIRGSGCPRFYCSANFNRKKLLIEMNVRQEAPSAQFATARPEEALASNPVQMFEGQMTVRIHEADGTPYEHVLDVKGPSKRYEVPFNTKYKRVRRNTKRFQARQAAAAAAAQGDEDAAEAIDLIDLGFGLGMWENETERENWKVADWTEEDEEKMSSAPYEWIRMDADFEWLAQIHFEQPDYMWVSQLQRDRDVVAQVSAVHALSQMPSLITSSMLTRTVLVSKYFYRIRTEAAYALVNCAIPQLEFLGLFHLLKLFRTQCCHDPPEEARDLNPLDVPCIPRANDFGDAADYFIQRALIHAISRVRNLRGRTLPQVKRFLINLLKYNDNSTNRYVDDHYLAGIMNALASAFVPVDSAVFGGFVPAHEDPDAMDDDNLLRQATEEVERLQELDKLVPSFHNVITLGALDWQVSMMLANLRPKDLQIFFSYTRQGNFAPVRIAAFNCLLLIGKLDQKVLARYCFAVLRLDESRVVKRVLARALCEGLAVAISTGAFGGAGLQGPETLLIEEGGDQAKEYEKAKEAQMESMLKSLKREIGRSAGVREGFLAALLSPSVDYEARLALLKLAELLFRPEEERELPFQPKVQLRVKMPSQSQPAAEQGTPVETPGATRIKLVRPQSTAAEAGLSTPDAAVKPVASPGPRVAFNAPELKPSPKAPKVKKAKPLLPGQASGMSSSDLTACRNCIKKLFENKHAPLFLNPVDPVRDKAKDYFDVIKEPMDLGSMANKLDSGQYRDRFHFKEDFELIIRNAKTYTPDSKAYVHTEAVGLEKAFNQLWTRMTKTLEQAAAKQAKHVAAKGRVANGDASASTRTSVEPSRDEESAISASETMPPPPSATMKPMAPPPTPETPSATPSRPVVKLKLKAKRSDGSSLTSSPAPSPAPVTPAPTSARTPKTASTSFAIRSEKSSSSKVLTASPSPSASPAPPAVAAAAGSKMKQSAEVSESSPSISEPPKKKIIKLTKRSLAPEPAPESPAPAPAQRQSSIDEEILAALGEVPDKPSRKVKVKETKHKSNGSEANLSSSSPAPVATPKSKKPAPLPAARASAKPVSRGVSPASSRNGTSPAPTSFKASSTLASTPPPPGKVKSTNAEIDPIGAAAGVPVNVKKCKALLQTLRKNPFAVFFLFPVDPVKDGLPTYFDEIKNPMDLSTMEAKLSRGQYKTMSDFAADVELIFDNCRTFNPPSTVPYEHADELQKVWRKEWAKTMVRKLEYQEKRSLQGMMNRLKNHPTSFLFRVAVDPVALGIPTYFDVIAKKDARDLSLIEAKLKADKYESVDSLDQDVKLMLRNCYTFNAADEGVCGLAREFESVYNKELNGVKQLLGLGGGGGGGGAGGQKRKDNGEGGGGGGSSKKSKVG